MPENTLSAFRHADSLGVDVLEMDIHASSDGRLVVIHDRTVNRTTDGRGRVDSMTVRELQALDAVPLGRCAGPLSPSEQRRAHSAFGGRPLRIRPPAIAHRDQAQLNAGRPAAMRDARAL